MKIIPYIFTGRNETDCQRRYVLRRRRDDLKGV